VSNDAGDATSRLSDALNEIFERSPADEPEGHGNGDGGGAVSAPNPGDRQSGGAPTEQVPRVVEQPYELPEIIPATRDATPPPIPRLPDPAYRPPVDAAPSQPSAAAPQAREAQQPAPAAASAPTSPAPASPAPPPTTGWADHVPSTTAPVGSQLRAPGRRPRVRRVTRVLRHIDPWSTFKVALLFSAVAYVVALTSGVLLWRVADSTGTLANVERWFTQFGWETFELKGGEIFQNAWIIGLFGVVAATGGAVLLATLFNLVSDIVGGVRMTVLEEEVVERTISSTRRYVVRRPPGTAGAPGGSVAADWSTDDFDDPDVSGDEPSTPSADSASASTQPTPTTQRTSTPATTLPNRPSADWSVDD
jgi:hypothetical protein